MIIKDDNNEFHLSHDEEDKLNQFQLITSFPEDELSGIVNLLRNHGWNLEAAIGRYFDGTWKETARFESVPESDIFATEPPEVPERIPNSSFIGDSITNDFAVNSGSVENLRDTGPFVDDIIRNRFLASQVVPKLPIVEALHPNFKQKYSVVGLNKALISHESTFQNNPFNVILMFVPKLLFRIAYNILSLLWGVLTMGFSFKSSDNSQMVCKIPARPSHDEVSINETILNLVESPENKQKLESIITSKNDHQKSFNTLLTECKDDFQFILVIVLGNLKEKEEHEADINSKRFISKVLSNTSVLNLLEDYVVKQKSLSVYIKSAIELEPWLVAKKLAIRHTPEVLLVGNVLNSNGSINGITRPSVLNKVRINSPNKFISSFKVAMDRFGSEIIVSKTEKEELRVAREIKELQNRAYETSLEQDRIKEEKKQLENEEKRLEQLEVEQREKEIKLFNTLKSLNWLKACVDILQDAISNNETGFLDTVKCANLQVRLAGGNRLIKKIRGDDSLYSLYVNIGCHLFLEDFSKNISNWVKILPLKIKELSEDDTLLCFKENNGFDIDFEINNLMNLINNELTKFETSLETSNYELDIDFELISPYPRVKIPISTDTKIHDTTELWPNGSLLVEEIINDEYTDDDSE
ncbi:hypothetical protein TPHA_0D02440 [Tetrapisispora phaffii CBS 4417]|uniref:Uncharacterized protein n=1 Tax=Tetrapisispora phaffii (strain ATCC 24235 / CBS 4417 / NBRC 1672 / NRRL Y-8282 / UCD 70-5) TaxID=1071381 RepID=G8BSR0_TETPH|nr:hypothetical protein TPHA_0D02440 [Tetrapisispora phaffii CBS 4417]CCE62881.1 hypothetical protein TPHA_0D02440 [Tetrapisispora phaffii CBS 4417]